MNIVVFILAEEPGLLGCISKTKNRTVFCMQRLEEPTSGVISEGKEKELFLDLLLSSSCLYSDIHA
jgi:hypothetical protein